MKKTSWAKPSLLLFFLLLPSFAFASELPDSDATHEFAVYAVTDAGAAEVTIYSDFWIDAGDLYDGTSYQDEDYPEPTKLDPVLDAMFTYLQVSDEEVEDQFTVEESYFILDEEDDWYVSLGIDLDNDIAEVLFIHSFYVESEDEDVLLAAGLERLHDLTRQDLEDHFDYYFKETQDSSIYGVVIISDLFGDESEASIFSDVDSDYEYYDAINYVETYGIVEGYSDGTYRPENEINRAEFTKILIEAKYPGEADAGDDCFTDVAADQWYAKYVCFAKDQGILSGYSDGSFKPSQSINIAEALKITLETYFPGEFEVSTDPWYQKYWDYAEENGFILDEWGSAGENLSRGAMAELIYRIEN
jgi:hypothetical protein